MKVIKYSLPLPHVLFLTYAHLTEMKRRFKDKVKVLRKESQAKCPRITPTLVSKIDLRKTLWCLI